MVDAELAAAWRSACYRSSGPVHTRDGKLSAQFEHTMAVTRTGVRVLTLRPAEKPLCRID